MRERECVCVCVCVTERVRESVCVCSGVDKCTTPDPTNVRRSCVLRACTTHISLVPSMVLNTSLRCMC